MIKNLLVLGLMVLAAQTSMAQACVDSELVTKARVLDLVGTAQFETLNDAGKILASEESSIQAATPEVTEYFNAAVAAENGRIEMVSSIFLAEDSAFVVLRLAENCQVVLFGTDGEDESIFAIDAIEAQSIQFTRSDDVHLKVTKIQ